MKTKTRFAWKQFLKNLAIIAIPVALQNMLTTTGSMIDTMMIAPLGETTVGAVGLCAQFSSLMFAGYWGFFGGGMLFFSQYWGAQDDDGIDHSYGLTLTCMMIVGLTFGAFAIFAPETVMKLYTDKESIQVIGAEYLRIIGFGYPVQVFSMAMSALLRSTERVRIPLFASIASVASNIFLNWVFIYGKFGLPEMGVRGAALATVLSQGISNRYSRKWNKVDVVLCPPTIDLRSVFTVLDFDKSNIDVGAQNCHWEPSGAFTGETSIPMLKDVGAAWCIVGHSERREYFGETDSMVNKKVRALAESSFNAIVCVGESLAVRDADDAIRFVCDQVRAALAGLDAREAEYCTIAYEPIWAIGTGRTATPEQAEEIAAAIRATVADLVGEQAAANMRVLYGGSMKPENADGFMACPNIDGGLIGGASLKVEDFCELVEIASGYAE